MMRIKKLAIVATGSFAMGALGLVIAQRAAAGGGALPQQSVDQNSGPISRPVGPDFRPIGAVSRLDGNPPKPTTIKTQTYYVGDLIGASVPVPAAATTTTPAAPSVQPLVDMNPIVGFIASTVAPGRWLVPDEALQLTFKNPYKAAPNASQPPVGSITPFYLSMSLIIECTPEVHDQVANFLRQLRDLVFARERRTMPPVTTEQPRSVQPDSTDHVPAPATEQRSVRPSSGSRQRVQQLLDELQREVAKLPPDET